MPKLRVHNLALSLDGYAAGPGQDLENPIGIGGLALHEWAFMTRTFRHMHGNEGGEIGIDDDFIARGLENIGAWILGRNMFGPVHGPWPDENWQGWWGKNPPYHTPVFVLTHYPRSAIVMEGSTTFHFISGGIDMALHEAFAAANGQDVRLGGGVATIRQYLQAGLVDEMHLAVTPVVLGEGENLLSGLNLTALGYQVSEHINSPLVSHIVLLKK
jgi:dihydrofolate reductase